ARAALRRERAADRQVPADLPRMTTAPASGRTRLLTIGAVFERLKPEFPDISISKIRYLEGEGLVTPARTRGGYRLFGEEELAPRVDAGERLYSESDAEIAAVCGRLAGFGIAPRHLRTFRTSVDRETGLLDAAVAPALRSRNPERRQQGTRDLQTLGELAQEL